MNEQEFLKRYSYNPTTDSLGHGGFGDVYRAYDNYLDRYVAIKVSQVRSDIESLRLRNEVGKAARLLHPNVAHYEECHTLMFPTGEFDFAVMQYYEDGSLNKLFDAKQLSREDCYDILTQILDGIAYLHNNGIIHRDLKPQNVLIARRGDRYIPKITDFGISKQLDDGQSSAVSNSVLGGTRSYASPEQLKERTIRKNTDLWSFGVIAYQMLVGSLPFNCGAYSTTSEEGRQEMFRQMMSGALPEALGDVPEPWQRLIRECLTVDNERRIAHADDCLAIIREGVKTAVDIKPEPIAILVEAAEAIPASAPAPTRGYINGHEWVDLGLPSGLKWATCNVGASNPGDYGNYYAWGETSPAPNNNYSIGNCSAWNQNIGDISGTSRDAARQNWGGSWRMPRASEIDELVNHCTWTWTTQNGHNGYRVTGPNGNSIFLPAAGWRYGSSSGYVGPIGDYWSSTPYESDTLGACCLGFDSGDQGLNWDDRGGGLSVRPVSE